MKAAEWLESRGGVSPETPKTAPAPATPASPRVKSDGMKAAEWLESRSEPEPAATSDPSEPAAAPKSKNALKKAAQRAAAKKKPVADLRSVTNVAKLQNRVQSGRGSVADAIELNEETAKLRPKSSG
jgi:hypothetical protein